MSQYEQLINMLVTSKIPYRIEHNDIKTVWTVIITKPEGLIKFHFDAKELNLTSIRIRDHR